MVDQGLAPDGPERDAIAQFERAVPEIATGVVVIRALARTPGVRTKVAVDSNDPLVDPIGACFGPQASRIKKIAADLGGEAVHVTMWCPDADEMVRRAISPLRVESVTLDEQSRRAVVTLSRMQPPSVDRLLSSQPLNPPRPRDDYLQLASRLSGWDIQIMDNPHPA